MPSSVSSSPLSSPTFSTFSTSSSGSSLDYESTGEKKALLIGIDYNECYGSPLLGPHKDVRGMRQLLIEKYGFKKNNIRLMMDSKTIKDPRHKPTRANIIAGMKWLVRDVTSSSSLFIHYSGHGGQVKDNNGDEVDYKDECIFPTDSFPPKDVGKQFTAVGKLHPTEKEYGEYETYMKGLSDNVIIDDELYEILVAPLPPGARLTALFDSCHSGSVLDLPCNYTDNGQPKHEMVDENTSERDLEYRASQLKKQIKLHAPIIAQIGHRSSQDPRPLPRFVPTKPSHSRYISLPGSLCEVINVVHDMKEIVVCGARRLLDEIESNEEDMSPIEHRTFSPWSLSSLDDTVRKAKHVYKAIPERDEIVDIIKETGSRVRNVRGHVRSVSDAAIRQVSHAMVVLISGCKDEQVSMDSQDADGRASGALTVAFLDVLEENSNSSLPLLHLLLSIRDKLKKSHHNQLPQLSTGHDIDLEETPFIL